MLSFLVKIVLLLGGWFEHNSQFFIGHDPSHNLKAHEEKCSYRAPKPSPVLRGGGGMPGAGAGLELVVPGTARGISWLVFDTMV